MGVNISRVPFAPIPSAEIEEDDAEIMNLFQGINTFRYDATTMCSSNAMSSIPASHQTLTTQNVMPAELIDYFNHNMPTEKII